MTPREIQLIETIRDANREITPADRHAILDMIEAANVRIAELEAALTVPDDAMPPDGQQWAKVCPEVAFHLIERHAENWAHVGQLMEAWREATIVGVIREALEATFEQRPGFLAKVSAAIRALPPLPEPPPAIEPEPDRDTKTIDMFGGA